MNTSRTIAMLRWFLYAALAATISSAYADPSSVKLECTNGPLVVDYANGNVTYLGMSFPITVTAQTITWTDNRDEKITIDRDTGAMTTYIPAREWSDGTETRAAYVSSGTCKVAEQKF